MTPEEAVSDLLSRSSCTRCGGPFLYEGTLTRHINWDPKGPVCMDCWFEETSEALELQREADWNEFRRECREQ